MKRKAVITVEFEAEDYLVVQDREAEIRRALETLRSAFETVNVHFCDRRPRLRPRAPAPERYWPTKLPDGSQVEGEA